MNKIFILSTPCLFLHLRIFVREIDDEYRELVDKVKIIGIFCVMKIIAGSLKGKILSYPKKGLRPTTDKVRGAIFNMVEANFPSLLNKTSVLDIFAGAGAVGIEALSRGANKATFIENNKITLKYLKANLKSLDDKTTIIPIDVIKALEKIRTGKFELIFLDPPYNMKLIEPAVTRIVKYNMLNINGILILEHHQNEQFIIPDDLELFKRKVYNDTVISIFVRRFNEKSSFSRKF
jgi:16S rRNA (guanine(966)-N(2))-methyltransferase RsmD